MRLRQLVGCDRLDAQLRDPLPDVVEHALAFQRMNATALRYAGRRGVGGYTRRLCRRGRDCLVERLLSAAVRLRSRDHCSELHVARFLAETVLCELAKVISADSRLKISQRRSDHHLLIHQREFARQIVDVGSRPRCGFRILVGNRFFERLVCVRSSGDEAGHAGLRIIRALRPRFVLGLLAGRHTDDVGFFPELVDVFLPRLRCHSAGEEVVRVRKQPNALGGPPCRSIHCSECLCAFLRSEARRVDRARGAHQFLAQRFAAARRRHEAVNQSPDLARFLVDAEVRRLEAIQAGEESIERCLIGIRDHRRRIAKRRHHDTLRRPRRQTPICRLRVIGRPRRLLLRAQPLRFL
ncbi:hypothetical protein X947_6083 [Burkholderia pseudomallei MSHR7334]|nr:hypothetical protein X947_6083 [Burkholderia pseudomallei MSHR7334]